MIIKRLKGDEQADKIHLWKKKLHHRDKSALKFAYGLLFADCQCFCSSIAFVPKSPCTAKTPAPCSYAVFMSYFLRIRILYCCCFVIFTWIIKFFHELAALFVSSINEVSAATLHSTIFFDWAGPGWAPTGQAANLKCFLNKTSSKLCDSFLRNDASGFGASRQN